jgi:hypothetical protein
LGFDNGKTNDWMMQVISAQGVSATVASLRWHRRELELKTFVWPIYYLLESGKAQTK